ncbi:mitochondrial carrier domain-containing protein [Ochromonadaceae sp. CCMP2298]|nr:mitochondrial carrier domain-containing protein [Ochromonadaceae sp. CCMP2298]|eukprot:CAMPEP_0173229306 /NCGR_PEP_ID=MMETSP1142-20121109/7044_1 /TAXON_ID=483371 /ORGANISM="non described non described, Strain CCMP2298" /LENGTH=381 /DNA_ID=CAMNT_0014158115 /DNA_START=501 /DNA_END=1646 /DNA_ORIENTATION=+
MAEGDELDWEEWKPSEISFVNHMLAGSVAGAVEHISIYPIDTIKTHIQYERSASLSPFETWLSATKIVKKEGFLRLWRGVSAMFIGCIPAHAAYFAIFEAMKKTLGADQKGHHPMAAAACGAVASVSHDLLITPFDVVKQRMQLGHYRSLTHCLRSVIQADGLRALYISLPTTVLMNIPFGGIMVAVNESVRKVLDPSGNVNVGASLLAGSIAGAVAAALTNPLDVIKTRLQTQNLEQSTLNKSPSYPYPNHSSSTSRAGSSSSIPHRKKSTFKSMPVGEGGFNLGFWNRDLSSSLLGTRSSSSSSNSGGGGKPGGPDQTISWKSYHKLAGVRETVRNILAEEGPAGFLRGIIPRMLVHAPSVAVSWTAYEAMKALISSRD